MADVLGMIVPQNEQEEIKEFVSTLLLLPKEDRAILLSNANAFKVRRDIERARKWGERMIENQKKERLEDALLEYIERHAKDVQPEIAATIPTAAMALVELWKTT